MKNIIFLFTIFLSCSTLPIEETRLQRVIDLPGMTKQQIYTKSLQWFAHSFRSANQVIQYKDFEEGKIIGSISTDFQILLSPGYAHSILTLDIKNSKARMTIVTERLDFAQGGSRGIYDSMELSIVQRRIIPIFDNYKNYMLTQQKSDDNW